MRIVVIFIEMARATGARSIHEGSYCARAEEPGSIQIASGCLFLVSYLLSPSPMGTFDHFIFLWNVSLPVRYDVVGQHSF